MLGSLVRVIRSGKQALARCGDAGDRVHGGRERHAHGARGGAGPDYDPIDPRLQMCAHEEGSIFLGDRKVPVTRPRSRSPLRQRRRREATMESLRKFQRTS